jgi:hypothetical protein
LQTVVWPYVLFLLAFVLSCLPFFDLRLLITLWYIQILLKTIQMPKEKEHKAKQLSAKHNAESKK